MSETSPSPEERHMKAHALRGSAVANRKAKRPTIRRRPAGTIAAEIVGEVFYKFGRVPGAKEHKLCLLITEAIAEERD